MAQEGNGTASRCSNRNGDNENRWSLHGMTALVTGGSKGIGHAIVEELARLGATMYTCSRNEAEINGCLKGWESKGFRVSGSTCDISSRSEREELMLTVSSLFNGKLNILINKVGTAILKLTEDYTAEMTTNFESAYHLSQLAHPLLKASGVGSIMFLSSVCGVVSVNVGSIYSGHQRAMNQLTKNLACEWAKDNIRSNSVAPWYIMTPLAEPILSNKKFHEEVIARTPLGRTGEPKEVTSRVGVKLGFRLIEIKVSNVKIDLDKKLSQPIRHHQTTLPLFDSVRLARVYAAEPRILGGIGFVSHQSGVV
ncbi:hypothetical protein NL676_005954 [Syzygium grande]|nr:hypothetical protein NL676_005954 [Syzygium grande]